MRQRGRPRKANRVVIPKEGELRRIRVQEIPNLENAGLSPIGHLAQMGYVKDPASATPDGKSYDMVMDAQKWHKEIYEPAKRRSRALQGLKGEGPVREKSVEEESFTGKDLYEAGMSVPVQHLDNG